jgi:transcriptional regulator with XRE-family HTH domain
MSLPMKLPDYLKRENITPSGFAESMGMPSSTITRILRGERRPSFEVVRRISKATNGEVALPEDFEIPTAEAAE